MPVLATLAVQLAMQGLQAAIAAHQTAVAENRDLTEAELTDLEAKGLNVSSLRFDKDFGIPAQP